MHRTRQILAICMLVVGVALIVRGAVGPPWGLSVQLIAGALLVVFGVLRLRYR